MNFHNNPESTISLINLELTQTDRIICCYLISGRVSSKPYSLFDYYLRNMFNNQENDLLNMIIEALRLMGIVHIYGIDLCFNCMKNNISFDPERLFNIRLYCQCTDSELILYLQRVFEVDIDITFELTTDYFFNKVSNYKINEKIEIVRSFLKEIHQESLLEDLHNIL